MQDVKFELGKFVRDYPHGRAGSAMIRATRWLSQNRLDSDWSQFDYPSFMGAPEEIYQDLEAEEIDYITAWGNLYKSAGQKAKKPVPAASDPIEQLVIAAGLSYARASAEEEMGEGDEFFD